MEPDDTMVVLGPDANNEPCRFGPVDEANRAVVTKEQIVGNLTDGWILWTAVPSNGKQELMLRGRQAGSPGLLLTPSLEVAQTSSERQESGVGLIRQHHSRYDIILLRCKSPNLTIRARPAPQHILSSAIGTVRWGDRTIQFRASTARRGKQ
jgi:hypothetical protein